MELVKRFKASYALVLVLLLVPIVFASNSYMIYSSGLVLLYIIMTMALNLLVGYGGQISIGHASFLAIGAFTSAILTLRLGLPFWLALPLSGFFTALIGFIVGLPAVKLSGHMLAVATLGFGAAVPELLLKWESVTGGTLGLTPDNPSIFGYEFDTDIKKYYLLAVITLLITWLIKNLLRGKIGRAFVAIRESEVSAAATGINVSLYKVLMFSISAFYTGIAGSLYAHFVGFISPHDFHISMSFLVLAMVIVGGTASIPGSYLGAILLAMIPQLTNHLPGVSFILTGISMVIIILFLPNGLIDIRKRGISRKRTRPGDGKAAVGTRQ